MRGRGKDRLGNTVPAVFEWAEAEGAGGGEGTREEGLLVQSLLSTRSTTRGRRGEERRGVERERERSSDERMGAIY